MIGVRDEIYNNKPYCPVGSASQNNTKPPLKFSSETNKDINQQPQPLRTHDDKSTLWMLIGYGGGILLGLIVIIFMFCCKPLRKRLYFFDHLQEMHYDDLNSNSHSTNKIIRQTKLGGILTVFFVCFAIGAASSLIIEFFTNNVDEKKSLVATMMVSELDITQINISRLVASIIFIDHYGVCINQSYEQIVPQDFVKCSDNIQVKTKNIISIGGQILHQCRQFNSTNKFKDPISNCEIQIYASNENISILFPDGSTESEGSEIEELNNKPQISISSLFEDAYCYGIRAQLETSTGIIERQFLNNIDKISKRTVLAVAQNQPFKGNEASIFEFIVAPSKYQSTDNNNSVGYQIMSHTLSPGSTAAGDEMHIKYGLETVIQLKQDSNIIQTIQTSRQKPAQFISNIFSTCIGYLSIFGGILMIIELIAQYRLPKTISESKIGSLRQNLFRPLQDDFENQQNLEIGNLSNNQTENSSNNQTRIANHYQAADQEEGDQN
ncbi:MAG: hypothetical protein EZS28_013411 [Streblomastix strix]|uniref:Transmembrane protein n=1 Tax=Streblomastix strix TaxID=222440 RepID=A0A5J4W812_9EUKA|nr:MAG: hypothetical protein EZS28_013411 [Streblomastix strix]